MPHDELDHARIRKIASAKASYQAICTTWAAGQRAASLFHTILEWIQKYAVIIKSQTDIADIFRRISAGDDLENIVGDFCNGSYADLYLEFGAADEAS